MSENISYPTEAMKRTAQEIRTLLDEQWTQHLALFQNNTDSFVTLTANLTRPVPGGKGEELQQHLEQWNQGMYTCYQSLYVLAEALERAGEDMTTIDQDVQQTFSDH